MSFSEDRSEDATPAGSTGTRGLFTSRPWSAPPAASPRVLETLRRQIPLQQPISEYFPPLLAGRGIVSPADMEGFFFSTTAGLHDPFDLQEMSAAVDRVMKAARSGERVAVHGDFDVDGLTGTALLHELFTALRVDGGRMRLQPPFVPDRIRDGYGVSDRMIRRWSEQGVDLLVTVDTGSSAGAALSMAGDAGMDIVVLDHHLFFERLPMITALVNPCRSGNTYPNPDLCGVGVAYKLAQAIAVSAPGALPEDFLASVTDLAALGLIADQMPLLGENRHIVRRGLERIGDRTTLRPGLAALFAVSTLDAGVPVTTSQLAFQIAPRLNACGRIGNVDTALNLLLTRDPREARTLAGEADATNTRRRETDAAVLAEAITAARPFVERGDGGLVLAADNWHRGVIGISAARLVETFNVPTILFSIEGDQARGSARSVPGLDIKAALDQCADLLIRYGGHAQAAGMSLETARLDAFREAWLQALSRVSDGDACPESYDLELPLQRMNAEMIDRLLKNIDQMEPFGEGNRAPIFRCNGLSLAGPPAVMGRTGDHLRFGFKGPSDPPAGGTPALSRKFVSFGSGRIWRDFVASAEGGASSLGDRRWDILFQISNNTWRPRNGAAVDPVQQQLVDIKPSEDTDD